MNSLKESPDFSFIVPLYNKEQYIGETLQSIAGQAAWRRSGMRYEIIVVNDGSTDRGAAVVHDAMDRGLPIRYFEQANAGVSAARNAGIAQARGKWSMCLDGDDVVRPAMVDTLLQIRGAFPDVRVAATGYSTVQAGSEVEHLSTRRDPGARIRRLNDLPRLWIRGALLHVGSTAFETDLAQSLQPCFPVGERCGEDVSFLFRLNHRDPFGYSSERMLVYRQVDQSGLSLTVTGDELRSFWARIEREFDRDHVPDARKASLKRFLARARELRAADLVRTGADQREARELLGEVPWMLRGTYWWRVAGRVLSASIRQHASRAAP